MLARLQQVAAEEGLPFGDRKYTYNSRLAQELGKWAEAQGRGDAFHHAAFHAYFAEGKNIAKRPVLLEIAREAGLSADEVGQVLETRVYSAAVDQDWNLSYRKGITAVPGFCLDETVLTGAQPYEMLEKMMLSAGVSRRGERKR